MVIGMTISGILILMIAMIVPGVMVLTIKVKGQD